MSGSSFQTLLAAAASAFPVIQGTNTSVEDPAVTTHTVALPASIAPGDLLVVILQVDTAPTVTMPAMWTKIVDTTVGGERFVIAYKTAESESGSIDFTTSLSRRSAHLSYRISGWSGAPEAPVAVDGLDPPSVSPSWGAVKTLVIVALGMANEPIGTISAYPSTYSGGFTSATGNERVGSAHKNVEASSEDPGAFTATAQVSETAATLAIKGS